MTSESTTTYREPATIFRGTVASSFHFGSKISMILKTPALPAAEHSLRLSAVDQNTVRVYTQVFLIFPFPDINQLEAAIAALTGGLRRTLEHYPFLAGTLSLADDDSGKVVLSYPTELPDLVASGLYKSKIINDFPEYKELKQRGMPPEEFTGRRLLPDDFSRYPGVPTDGEGLVDFENGNKAPVMRIQANFTPGGLVLAVYTHHSVMDCSGINTFWTSFAENINLTRLRNAGLIADLTSSDNTPDQSTMRQELDERAPTYAPGQAPGAEAYIDGTYTYPKSLPDGTPCSLKYFIISAARIRSLRDHLKQRFPQEPPLTICNVLAALLWIHVTRARAFRRGDCEYETTNIGIATDLRKRMTPPLGPEYMGNMAIFSKGALKVEDFTAEERVTDTTIVRAISEIRRTIAKVDNEWVTKHIGFFKSIDQVKDTECALGFRFGMDIYITSWMNFGAELQWGIPGTDLDEGSLDGRVDFVRRSFGPSDGGMMIMPRRRALVKGEEAPYEVMVRLATVDMNRLLEEEGGLSSWAERVI